MRSLWEELESLYTLPAITTVTTEVICFIEAIQKQKEEQKLFQFQVFNLLGWNESIVVAWVGTNITRHLTPLHISCKFCAVWFTLVPHWLKISFFGLSFSLVLIPSPIFVFRLASREANNILAYSVVCPLLLHTLHCNRGWAFIIPPPIPLLYIARFSGSSFTCPMRVNFQNVHKFVQYFRCL